MNHNPPTHTEPEAPAVQAVHLTSRLPYEAPELMIYNTSVITMGGINPKGADKLGALTSYAVS